MAESPDASPHGESSQGEPQHGESEHRAPEQHVQEHREMARVRRAPKFAVFLVAGAILGIVVAFILTFAFAGTGEASPNTGVVYSQGQVFGFLALICITVGLALGGIVALVLDRRSARHTRQLAIDHEHVVTPHRNGDHNRH